jgi:PPOX class probable F420-dependent enzyme
MASAMHHGERKSMMQLDTSTEFGKRAERRLREEEVIWLTTVRQDGTPQPTPVWFLWDGGDSLLIYSRPGQQKERNIARNPHVALNFDSDGKGGNIIVLSGTAEIVTDVPPARENAAYVRKYDAAITRIGMDRDSFAQAYSQAIRVTLTAIRGH